MGRITQDYNSSDDEEEEEEKVEESTIVQELAKDSLGNKVPIPQLQTFNIKEIMKDTKNCSVIIYSKRRSGKSVLLRHLLYDTKDWYDNIYVFSQSAHLQKDLFDYAPEKNVFRGFQVEKIKEIWSRQEMFITQEVEKGKDKKKLPYILLIFDDIIGDPKVRTTSVFNDLFILGRHVNIAVYVLSQSVGGKFGINQVCRRNLDLAITFWLDAENDRKLYVEQYLSAENKKVGEQLLRSVTAKPYTAIICCNFKTERNVEDCIYEFKAKENIPKFEIGKKQVLTQLQLQELNEVAFSGSRHQINLHNNIRNSREENNWWENHGNNY